ncbi:hypothetical protein WN943_001370 [Citrus x changshan-huyou]
MFKISPGDFGLVVDIWSTIVFALFCPMHFSSTRSHFMKILCHSGPFGEDIYTNDIFPFGLQDSYTAAIDYLILARELGILCLFIYSSCSFEHFLLYRDESDLSTRDLQKLVQALSKCRVQIDKLSLHVEVSFLFTPIKTDVRKERERRGGKWARYKIIPILLFLTSLKNCLQFK